MVHLICFELMILVFFQRCLIFDGFVMGEKIVIEGA